MGEKVGLIGVGLMGSAMSEQFIEAGYEVQGYDIDARRLNNLEERGGRAVSSPELSPGRTTCAGEKKQTQEKKTQTQDTTQPAR